MFKIYAIGGALLLIMAVLFYGAYTIRSLQTDLATANVEKQVAEQNLQTANAVNDAVVTAQNKIAAERDALQERLSSVRKNVQNAPKTTTCGPSVRAALDGLRVKPAGDQDSSAVSDTSK